MGSFVPYLARNRVIGGSEPRSDRQDAVEIETARRRGRVGLRIPERIGRPFDAKRRGICGYCREPVAAGAPIVRARFPNGREAWVHAECSNLPRGPRG